MTRLTTRLSVIVAYQLFAGVGAALAHCPEIHKGCDRPIRSCQADTNCPGDSQCANAVCDTSVSTATRCFVTVTHAGTCAVDTQLTAAFDVQDFPTVADQRIPDAGNLPIVEVSGNAVCAAGPSLPCVIGPAGSTGNGLPGAGAPGLVSFAAEHTLSPAQLQDLAAANASQLNDRATVTLQDLCTPGPDCNSNPSDLQVTASSSVSNGCSQVNSPVGTSCQSDDRCEVHQCDGSGSCVAVSNVQCDTSQCQVCAPDTGQCVVDPNDSRCAAGVDLSVDKTADCVCDEDPAHLTAASGTGGEVVVCGDGDDHRTAASRRDDHGKHHGSDHGSKDDHGSNDHGSADHGDGHDDGSGDHGSADHGSHDGKSHDGKSHDGKSDDGLPDGSPAGCTVGFTITVTNHGSATATNVVVNDTVPGSLVLVDAFASQGSFDPATGTWLVGTLAGGASATLTIHEDRGDDRGQCIENCAELVSVDQGDTNSSNDRDCVTVFTGGGDDGRSHDGHSTDSDDHNSKDGKSGDGESHDGLHRSAGLGTSAGDDSSDSRSEDGAICLPDGGDDHVCDEAVPAKWHKAHERWSRLVTKAAQATSHRQASASLRKAKAALRRMKRITTKFERSGAVSDECIGKLRARLQSLTTETRRIAG